MVKISGSDDLALLREQLTHWAKLYVGGELTHQRFAVANALMDVSKYLEANNFPPDTLLPVIRPMIALVALQNNALDQMFSQRLRKGRPSATMNDHIRTAILSVFADVWLEIRAADDRPQPSKLDEAARKMRGSWFGDIDRAKLETAREIVSRELKTHLAVEFAQGFRSFFDDVIDMLGKERAFLLMIRYVNEHEISQSMGILKTPPIS